MARGPLEEGAGDRVAGDVVVDAAGGDRLLHDWIIRRERAHGGRAVPTGKALAAGERSEPAGPLADEETPDRHRPHERLDGPDQARQVLQHPALEDLGVVPIRGGERLRDGGTEHDVFAGGAPVVEEDPAEGMTSLFDIDGKIRLADQPAAARRCRGTKSTANSVASSCPSASARGSSCACTCSAESKAVAGEPIRTAANARHSPRCQRPTLPGRCRHRKAANASVPIVPNPRSHPAGCCLRPGREPFPRLAVTFPLG